MALSRAEEWAKAKEFVAEHADELRELDSPSALFKYCEKNRQGGKSLWPKVRTELRKQLGIDLDQMRADAAAALADKARHLSDSSADAPTVELYTAGELLEKPSRDDPDEVEIVRLGIECSPCFERTCRFGHYNCLRLLEPDSVIQALGRIGAAPVEVA